MRTTIIYEDKDIIVARKPAGLATQTSRVGQPDMVSELKNYLKGAYLGIVHRLDQPVEGLLVFGKTKAASADLTKQLSDGALNKRYYAVLCGQPASAENELVDYLYKNKDSRAEIVPQIRAAETGAKRAVLRYRILDSVAADAVSEQVQISLADITIETGRFHQIRAQMAHAGTPLLGDAKYKTALSAELSERLNVANVALCACDLLFYHPQNREEMHFHIEPREKIFRFFSKKFPEKP